MIPSGTNSPPAEVSIQLKMSKKGVDSPFLFNSAV